jgi:hypothetical protein
MSGRDDPRKCWHAPRVGTPLRAAPRIGLATAERIHQTLRMTPAVAAGVTDHVWEIGEIVDMLG